MFETSTAPKLAWEKSYRYALDTGISGMSGVLFIPVADNKLYLISANTGMRIAEIKFREPVMAPVAVYDSLAAINIGGRKLLVINWVTRKASWEVELKDVFVTPSIWQNRIFWTDGTDILRCFDIEEGKRIWDVRLDKPQGNNLVVDSLGLIRYTDSGIIECYDPLTGQWQWTFDAGERIRNAPKLMDRYLFFCTSEGTVARLNIENGEPSWIKRLDSPVYGEIEIDRDGVYLGTSDSELLKLDYDSGGLLWSNKIDGSVKSGPSIWGNFAVFASIDHHAYFVERKSGRIRSSFESKGMLTSKPLVCGNRVFLAGEDAYLYCFDLGEGD